MTAETRRPRRFSKADRDAAYENSQDAAGQARCEYCDEELKRESGQSTSYEADHRYPHSKGGASSAESLAPACRTCNRGKGAKELDTDWIPPKDR
jgi:5-methylcytosine-specific restriction endonuclease McrA